MDHGAGSAGVSCSAVWSHDAAYPAQGPVRVRRFSQAGTKLAHRPAGEHVGGRFDAERAHQETLRHLGLAGGGTATVQVLLPRLVAQPVQCRPCFDNERLEFGIGIAPEVGNIAVVLNGLLVLSKPFGDVPALEPPQPLCGVPE